MKKMARMIGTILFLVGAFLLLAGRSYVIPAFSKPVDIMEDGMEGIKLNQAVETDLNIVFERFSRRDDRDYYVIPVWSGDMSYVVPISVSGINAGSYTKVVEETMDYAYGYTDDYGTKTVHFQGVAVELDDVTAGKMKDWFREIGFFERESDMDEYMLPWMLYQVNLTGVKQNTIVFSGMILVGLVLLCLGIFTRSKTDVTLELKETKINGVIYQMEQLKALNDLIMKGSRQEAHDILTRDFNVESGYAAFVVDNWSEYYY